MALFLLYLKTMLQLKTLCALVLCLVLPGWKLVSQANVFALSSIADQHPRSEREVKFRPGPGGEDCELDDTSGDITYPHTDGNGNECRCTLCLPGRRFVDNCTCDPSQPNIPQLSICVALDPGYFISGRHKCRQGHRCKQCPYPMKMVSPCRPTKDTECGCVEGFCLMSSGDCLACPRNESGQDSVSGDANFTDRMSSDGMGGEVTHGPERVSPEDEDALHVDSPDDTKVTDRPAVVVESSSVENDDGVDPSTVPNDECIISTGCPPVWVLVITHVSTFVLGIIVCYSKKLWETLRRCFPQGVSEPADQGNSLELGRAGGRGRPKKGKKACKNRKRSQSRKKRQGQTNSTAV